MTPEQKISTQARTPLCNLVAAMSSSNFLMHCCRSCLEDCNHSKDEDQQKVATDTKEMGFLKNDRVVRTSLDHNTTPPTGLATKMMGRIEMNLQAQPQSPSDEGAQIVI